MKIIQLKNYTHTQMTGFIVVTEDHHIIVVDGGNGKDTDGFLARLQWVAAKYNCPYRVDLWLLTHPHDDHYGVFCRLSRMERAGVQGLPEICSFAYEPLDDSYAFTDHSKISWQLPELNAELAVTHLPLHPFRKGDRYSFGSLTVEILRTANPAIPGLNNASAVIRFTEQRDSADDFVWLVLGDLSVSGGEELLRMYPDGLAADAVQMAHHGQNGVDRPVYEAIRPRFAFWTTPDWLWTNTDPHGGEPGKGPFATLRVRQWMEELGARPIRASESDMELDTLTETSAALPTPF